MTEDHIGHQVVDLLTEMKEKNIPKINLLTERIAKKEEKLHTVRKERDKVAKDCLEAITKRKKELAKIFDEMMEKVEEQQWTTESDITIRCPNLKEQLEQLKGIKEIMEKAEFITNDDIVFIEKAEERVLQETPMYSSVIYDNSNFEQADTRKLCGNLISVGPSFQTPCKGFFCLPSGEHPRIIVKINRKSIFLHFLYCF